MSRSRLQSLISNIDHMTCLLSSKNSPRNTVDFEAACSVYIRFRGVNSYRTVSNMLVWKTYFGTAPYASRNHVENHLGEQITFFHLDCLCSDVRLNVDFDLTLTVLADLLYRRLAERLKGFVRTGPARLFRKFVDTSGMIEITANERRFSRRRNLPNRHPKLHNRIYLDPSIVLILAKYNDTYALNVLPQIPVRRWASESVS